ncbi:MAG: helix-turn-helix domain-containing protein [Oscillospiraceae bacterium]
MINIASNVKSIRKKRNLTQRELAKRASVSYTMMSYIEQGIKLPSLSLSVRLADALECSLDELVGRKVS